MGGPLDDSIGRNSLIDAERESWRESWSYSASRNTNADDLAACFANADGNPSAASTTKSQFSDPFVVLSLVIVAIGCLSPYFVGFTAPEIGEYDASVALNISPDVIALLAVLIDWYRTPAPSAPRGLKAIKILPDPLLKAYATVDLLEFSMGFGPPYEGDELKECAQQFSRVHEQLNATFPDARWRGAAAQTYAGQVATLRETTQSLTDLNQELAALVKDQAHWVTHMHLGFGLLKMLLIIAEIAAARALAYNCFVRPDNAIPTIQKCAWVGVAMALGMVGTLDGLSWDKVGKINTVKRAYQHLGAGGS